MEQQLVDAVRDEQLADVKLLLRTHPTIDVNWGNENCSNAIRIAADKNYGEIMKELLAHPGIDVNVTDNYGNTALIIACAYGNLDCVKLLIKDSRVNTNLLDTLGNSAFMYAVYFGKLDVVKWLLTLIDTEDQERRPNLEIHYVSISGSIIKMAKERKNEKMVKLL